MNHAKKMVKFNRKIPESVTSNNHVTHRHFPNIRLQGGENILSVIGHVTFRNDRLKRACTMTAN
jgi:hypothetical protein